MELLTVFVLGLLMILDPCTLMTSVAAIGYIDREMENRRRVLVCGLAFVAGKIATYLLLSIPFILGGETDWVHNIIAQYGEPLMGGFLAICGLVLLIAGHHHHEHDHGMSKWLKTVDESSYPFWAFMLGIFFAIAFCPHRLIYFLTMIDITISAGQYIYPLIFGLGTALPILLLAWAIPYGIVSIDGLKAQLAKSERVIRILCAILFITIGIYMLHPLLHVSL